MSAKGNVWCVRSAGSLVEGFDRQTVVNGFASTFKVDETRAITYLENGVLISENLKQADATRYKSKLAQLGLVATVHDQSNLSAEAANSPGFSIDTSPPSTPSLSVDSSATISPSIAVDTPAFSCPKCAQVQEKTDQCSGCGIFFEKYIRREAELAEVGAAAVKPGGASARSESELSLVAIAAATIVALVFALVWEFVAIQFEREMGFIAWAVGGAVGGAAVFFGGRGTLTATICGCLVVASIFLGKYLIVSTYLDETIAQLEMVGNQDWGDVYQEAVSTERGLYASIPKDDNSIKQFMIDHEYTKATSVATVPADDFKFFKEQFEPWLASSASGEMQAASHMAEGFKATMGEISPWTLVKESLGVVDLIFLLLGVGTAFRLVAAARPG